MEIVKLCFFFNNDSQSVTHWVSDYITSRTVLKSSQTWGVARPLFYEGRNASLQQIRLAKAKSAKIIYAWMGEGDNFQMSLLIVGSPFSLLGLAEIHHHKTKRAPSVTFCKSITFFVTFLCFSKHLREFPHHFLQRLWRKPGCYHPQRLTDFFVRSKFINASHVILMPRMCNAVCQVCLYYITLTLQWQPHFFLHQYG